MCKLRSPREKINFHLRRSEKPLEVSVGRQVGPQLVGVHELLAADLANELLVLAVNVSLKNFLEHS